MYKDDWAKNDKWKGYLNYTEKEKVVCRLFESSFITIKDLKAIRAESGLTQVEASKLSGLSEYTWCGMENGVYKIRSVYARIVWAYTYLPEAAQLILLSKGKKTTHRNIKKPVIRKSSQFTKTERTIKAHDLIVRSVNGVTFKIMKSKLKCSMATLYRLIDDLQLLNKNIYIEDKHFFIKT